MTGQQVTVEGYHDGTRAHVYGVIDSHNYEGTPCFQRYQYPSQLPETAIQRLTDVTTRVIEHIGLRSTFNIEFFWNTETEQINILEINPRISQSHARLFEQVDGVANHHCMVRLGLGQTPELPHRRGPYPMAAKWFCRRFSADARVRRSPTPDEVAELERSTPGVHIEIEAERGTRLSELAAQDSYSYNLAIVHVGAHNQQELEDKYRRCVDSLPFEFNE